MLLTALIIIPCAAGLLAFVLRAVRLRRAVLIGAALAHMALTGLCWLRPPPAAWHGWLFLDPIGLLFLSITSVLFCAAALYCVAYLRREAQGTHADYEAGFLFENQPEAVFLGCLLVFLSMMTLACMSQHLGLLWVAIEGTTLASAPLIHFHRQHHSLEAAWKYLLICSIGIALALLGTFCINVAGLTPTSHVPLMLRDLLANAGRLDHAWLKAAFVLLVIGYGTKMGLAPMHTWLPDAHSEAPSVVSALLSGALLNCAFVALLRTQQVCVAAGLEHYTGQVLRWFGLFSMGVAALMIISQTDFKRMLAYSSVEHMGILALGVGIGGAGVFGALLHALNHSLAKALLFLVAGNIIALYHTKEIKNVHDLLRRAPWTGMLWLAGILAIVGMPPFGLFISEFVILSGALGQQHYLAATIYLVLLCVIFAGMLNCATSMVYRHESHAPVQPAARTTALALLPPLGLALLVLILGLYLPAWLARVLALAAALVRGGAL